MKINLGPSFKAAIQLWILLAVGIITASILATFLTVVGVSKNISLSVAFFYLIGVSIIGLVKVPHSFLTIESELQVQRPRQRQLVLTAIALLLIIGTILWILDVGGASNSSLPSIIGALFTVLGTLIALSPQTSKDLSIPSSPIVEDAELGIKEGKSAIIIYTKRDLRGESILLARGFDTQDNKASLAANVIGRKGDKYIAYVAVFPQLEPGNYTVFAPSKKHEAKITVYPKRVTQIDWR